MRTETSEALLHRHNISVCLYPPQANRSGVPDMAHSPSGTPVLPDWSVTLSQALPDDLLMEFDRRLHAVKKPDAPLSDTVWATELARLLGDLAERVVELRPFLTALRTEAVHDPLLRKVWEELENHITPTQTPVQVSLAPRERQVLELAATGASNVSIAQTLGLQAVTVTKALSRAYTKLGAKNRGEAIFKWIVSQSS